MKRVVFLQILLLLVSVSAFADGPSLSGSWKLNERVLLDPAADPVTGKKPESGSYLDSFSRLRVQLDADVAENVGVRISGDFKLYNSTGLYRHAADDPMTDFYIDATLWEAYFTFEDIVEGMDLTIGKQRIAWGTADKFNPTDQLNPYDLSDIMDMWEHVPTIAMKLSYTPSDTIGFDVIWEPTAKPALLPRDPYLQHLFINALGIGMDKLPQILNTHGYTLNTTTSISDSNFDIKHSLEAVKIRGTIGEVDYSVSYIHGWQSIPVPAGFSLRLDPTDPTNKTIDMDAKLKMFEYHMIGADADWTLWGLGWRIEGAVYFPTGAVYMRPPDSKDPNFQAVMKTFIKDGKLMKDLAPYATVMTKAVKVIPDHPYFNLTAGIDYSFSWNMYVNFQYIHGLMVERGDEKDIHDYFMLRVEQRLFYDKLKLSVSGIGGILDWSNIGDNYSYMVIPEVQWIPYDSLKLAVGGWILGGEGPSFLTAFNDLDMVYLRTEVDF